MQRNTTHMNHKLLLCLTFLSFIFISCVYFNTFYNAETSYRKALIIIEESPITSEDKLPSQASKLLGEAIENSKLVIEDYPESKYVDDAIFIIGRASFLRDEVAVAEKHFEMILDLYPESRFYQLSEIWLAYTHFRMGMIDSAQVVLNKIYSREPSDKNQLFIIHNVLAEIAMEVDDLEQVYQHYELAAGTITSNSKKTAIYGRLVNIAEQRGDKIRASIYLEELGKVAPDKIRIESRMQLIIYQRELGEYDKIIEEIGNLLSLSEFQAQYIKLELELGKVYMEKGDFSTAKEILTQMVEVYSKKDESAEAYFHLGDMALIEDFNLDLAKEYFENSKSERSQSKYGKISKTILKKITRFENLENLYKEVIKYTDKGYDLDQSDQGSKYDEIETKENKIEDKPHLLEEKFTQNARSQNYRNSMDFDSNNILEDADIAVQEELEPSSESPDSILFMIGEMLLYDFNHLKRSLDKFKTLAEKYPKSEFAPQALYVLSHFEPDGDWHYRLKINFPNSSFFSMDSTSNITTRNTSLESMRDYAWSLTQQSYQDAYLEFNRLSNEEEDTLSAYITGFISDIYLNDIELAITHYQSFSDKYFDHVYADIVDNRLMEIQSNLEDIIATSQQGINYQLAVNYLHREYNFDSVKVLLSEITSGISSSYKYSANNLKDAIREYKKLSTEIRSLDTLLVEDVTEGEMLMPKPPVVTYKDSILYGLAILFDHKLESIDSAIFYHASLVRSFKDSKYRSSSLIYLCELEPGGNWAEILRSDYSDTSFVVDGSIAHSIYSEDIFEDGFSDKMFAKISDCEKYLDLFTESIDSILMYSDSSLYKIDNIDIKKDSSEINVNLDSLQSDLPAGMGEIKP